MSSPLRGGPFAFLSPFAEFSLSLLTTRVKGVTLPTTVGLCAGFPPFPAPHPAEDGVAGQAAPSIEARQGSSVAEQVAHNHPVASSTLAPATLTALLPVALMQPRSGKVRQPFSQQARTSCHHL